MAPCETQQDSTAYVDPTIDHRNIKTEGNHELIRSIGLQSETEKIKGGF